MAEIQKLNDLYIENDKWQSPFLLAASFRGLLTFHRSFIDNGILYWEFSPKDKANLLLEQFRTKTEPHIPAIDLFQAINEFWKQVSKARNGEIKNERQKT